MAQSENVAGKKKLLARVANLLIAALCYFLLFAFAFNIKPKTYELANSPNAVIAVTDNVPASVTPQVKSQHSSPKVSRNDAGGGKRDNRPYRPNLANNIREYDARPAGDDIWILYEIDGEPDAASQAVDAAGMPVDINSANDGKVDTASLNLPDGSGEVDKLKGDGKGKSDTTGDGDKGDKAGKQDTEDKADNNSGKEGEDGKENADYVEQALARIESKKLYPRLARDAHIEGTVVLSITITKKGYLDKVKIVNKSGSAMLDEAAIAAVKKAAPFGKFPQNINKDSITIETPIVFHLK